MKFLISWLKRKKASLCILAAICAISLFAILTSENKINLNSGGMYAVKIKHYGIDAAEMERSVTIPLEDAFYSIPGVMSVHSSSENSASNVYVRFKAGIHGRYEAVRDAAQRIYETLPSSAQRPEILSSNNSMIPVWSAAVIAKNKVNTTKEASDENVLTSQSQTLSMLEKIVKPRLESLEGAGEVIISGAGIKEIYIILDQEKINLIGLRPSAVASVLAMNDSIFSGGSVTHKNTEIIITVDGRCDQIHSLNDALIPIGDGKSIELSEIALIVEQEREPDVLSRLNGEKTASIAIMGQHGGDLKKLSSQIKKELSSFSLPVEFIVLSDLGAEEALAFKSVFNAALLGAIMVAIIGFLLNGKKRFNIAGIFCAFSIPLICVISAAILLIFGFSMDRLLLAGIAAGIGTAIDAVILCSEKLRKFISRETSASNDADTSNNAGVNYESAAAALKSLAGPLLAGAATTVAALIPLTVIEDGGAKIIANAVAVVTVTAFVLSLSLLPPLLLWRLDLKKPVSIFSMPLFLTIKIKLTLRQLDKFLAASVNFCYRHSILILLISGVITISAVLLLFAKGADTTSYGSEDSVYAQVEFEGGLLAEEVDRLLSNYSRQLAQHSQRAQYSLRAQQAQHPQETQHSQQANEKGIINIETGARIGSGSLLISFDPKILKPQQVRDMAKQISIPGGFIFFHDNSQKDRYWQIFIYGDEDKKCRELAEELAYYCSNVPLDANNPLVKERVLNFKQGSKKMILLPNREIFAEAKVSFSETINMARLRVYGPVVYKRNNSEEETDVRIRSGGIEDFKYYASHKSVMRQSREGTLKTLVLTGNDELNSSIFLNSLTETKDEYEPSSIRRDNRRRYASITISTKPMDPRRVKEKLSDVFKKLELPAGYSIEFDPEAVKQSEGLTATVLSLLLAIVFCYMIIAAINESFRIPLLILSAIPPSLAIPAICLVLSGSAYNSAIACAFIAVSGMTVNAAVICVDSIRSLIRGGKKNTALTVYLALRQKMPALLATTGTTAAGAIPFLFLTENANTLIRTLSLVGALGVTGSLICSITLIPSLLSLSKKIFKEVVTKT
ncbi:MAG: efflux RND transporter permease subunit [Treponema sp.]|nr:efflux RND transporter permease subunit [Treponema sp.]